MKKLAVLLVSLLSVIGYSQNNPQWIIYDTTNSSVPSNYVGDIVIDQLNRKWISFYESGILKIDSIFWTVYNTSNSNIPTNSFSTINVDNESNLWGGLGNLLSKFDGTNWVVYGIPDSTPPGHSISSIVFDSLNNVWFLKNINAPISSPHYLVEFKDDSLWQTHLSLELANGHRQLLLNNQSIWIGDGEGLYLFENDSLQYFQPQNGPIGLYCTDVKIDSLNNIWLATGLAGWGYLVKFNGINYSGFNFIATAIEFDNDGNLWIGTESFTNNAELIKFDGTNWTTFNSTNSQLPQTYSINDLTFDKFGNLWIATASAGLVVFNENGIVPVELASFTSSVTDNNVTLSWQTATETNNRGFQIERRKTQNESNENWNSIGFVNGNGTTTEPQSYSFVDKDLEAGKYNYRLKQIDFDGTFEYSNTIEVEINVPSKFSLEQNYPNPFNPNTIIQYSISSRQFVSIKVFDVLGKEVATLVNEEKNAGNYNIEFNPESSIKNPASGIYFYQLKAGNFIETKKMTLLK
ncbi:MAG TPA: T9SS type A sorting domain-containing protein [Ignavibacteriaceae bacterium]|nr:T9SS type A sorting domain-containing protein [Ignavibacteriaceae bacterium]